MEARPLRKAQAYARGGTVDAPPLREAQGDANYRSEVRRGCPRRGSAAHTHPSFRHAHVIPAKAGIQMGRGDEGRPERKRTP